MRRLRRTPSIREIRIATNRRRRAITTSERHRSQRYLALGGRAASPREGSVEIVEAKADERRPRSPMPVELTAEERAAGDAWCEDLDARMRARLADDGGAEFQAWKRAWDESHDNEPWSHG